VDKKMTMNRGVYRNRALEGKVKKKGKRGKKGKNVKKVKKVKPSKSCKRCLKYFCSNYGPSRWEAELKKVHKPNKRALRTVAKNLRNTCRSSCGKAMPTNKKLRMFGKSKNKDNFFNFFEVFHLMEKNNIFETLIKTRTE
jgi:hypothetical protein